MDAEPKCIACGVKRTLIGVMPVRNQHEMQSFECPRCKGIFRLVTRREPRQPADRVSAGFTAAG